MKDKSLVLKKLARGRRQKAIIDDPEIWKEVNDLGNLSGAEFAQVVKKMLNILGVKVEKSNHGKLRIMEYLSEEQEKALLGDNNE